ncbi:MAG: peptidoglycan-binding protein [Polyangiales bacterium]
MRALQTALREAGYDVDVDGSFGDATYEAVRDLQANNDLDVDGVVGPDTWAVLGVEGDGKSGDEGDDEGDDEGYEQLSRGDEGDLVMLLQEALSEAGYEVDVDGVFGADTERAVRRFQQANDLDVDGIVGDDTWEVLEDFMADDEEE